MIENDKLREMALKVQTAKTVASRSRLIGAVYQYLRPLLLGSATKWCKADPEGAMQDFALVLPKVIAQYDPTILAALPYFASAIRFKMVSYYNAQRRKGTAYRQVMKEGKTDLRFDMPLDGLCHPVGDYLIDKHDDFAQLDRMLDAASTLKRIGGWAWKFSALERNVAQLYLIDGLTMRQTADALDISMKAVDNAITRFQRKVRSAENLRLLNLADDQSKR